MPLQESLTAMERERLRVFLASLPTPLAAERIMPPVASTSEPSPSLRPFQTPGPTHASLNGTAPLAVTPSPFPAAPLLSAAAARVASSSLSFGWGGQTNNNSFPSGGQSNNNSFPSANVTARVPGGTNSFSMPSSLVPSIQAQVSLMHRALEEHDDNLSIASGLSTAHILLRFQPWIGQSVEPRFLLVILS